MRHPPDPAPEPDHAFAALRDADPDVMERDELAELTRLIAAHRAWCDALQVRVTRRQRQLAEAGRGEAPKDLLVGCGGQSSRDARTADERQQICDQLPQFEHALQNGAVSAGHLDAIAAATRQLDEPARAEFAGHADGLLADAVRLGVDAFERECRDLARLILTTSNTGDDLDELERQRRASRIKRWTDRETGMRNTLISLDPIRDAQLWSAIDAARRAQRQQPGHVGGPGQPGQPGRRVDFEQRQVDALLAAVTGASAPTGGGVIVLIDLDTISDGLHQQGICELADGTPIPVETARQLACQHGVIPIVLDGAGRALEVGRTKRLATEAQRQALLAMHRTCVYPGCTVGVEQCEIHHVVPFERGGTTDLDNLVPLCLANGHHHLVHEGGWALTVTPDRTITLRRPDNDIWYTASAINRAPHGVAPLPPTAA